MVIYITIYIKQTDKHKMKIKNILYQAAAIAMYYLNEKSNATLATFTLKLSLLYQAIKYAQSQSP